MSAHVLTRSDTRFVLEHAREMMRVIEAEQVCSFADAVVRSRQLQMDSRQLKDYSNR